MAIFYVSFTMGKNMGKSKYDLGLPGSLISMKN